MEEKFVDPDVGNLSLIHIPRFMESNKMDEGFESRVHAIYCNRLCRDLTTQKMDCYCFVKDLQYPDENQLFYSCELGEDISIFLQNHKNVDINMKLFDTCGINKDGKCCKEPPIMVVIMNGNEKNFEALISHAKFDTNVIDWHGNGIKYYLDKYGTKLMKEMYKKRFEKIDVVE